MHCISSELQLCYKLYWIKVAIALIDASTFKYSTFLFYTIYKVHSVRRIPVSIRPREMDKYSKAIAMHIDRALLLAKATTEDNSNKSRCEQ